jgi:hypothetical protein
MGKPKKENKKREKQEQKLGSKKIQRIMGNQDLEREYSGIKKNDIMFDTLLVMESKGNL